MNYKIIYSPLALDDLRNIYSYISFELKSPDTAAKQVKKIRERIKALNTLPERYSLVDWEPWKSIDMRKIPVSNYTVFYKVDSSELSVTIVRIIYSGRDIEYIINNTEKS